MISSNIKVVKDVSNITRQENVPLFYKWRVPLWLLVGENISRLDEMPDNSDIQGVQGNCGCCG